MKKESRTRYSHLKVSAALLVSAVLEGFVLVSKLNALGLRECGEAVVEFAIQIFDSDNCVGMVADVVELELFGVFWHMDAIVVAATWLLTWPKAIAMGLGDESGDDVKEETWNSFKWIFGKN